MIRTALVIAFTALSGLSQAQAQAQSLSPMRAEIVSFGEYGAVRAALRNPYSVARRFDIEVFSEDWTPLKGARLSRTTLALGPGSKTSVMAFLPVSAEGAHDVFLCVTSRAYRQSSGASVRGQVCGRYHVVRGQL